MLLGLQKPASPRRPSMASSSNITLKLITDKNTERVLFAEAGKDFVDFLFSLLFLPVGTVIRLLDNPDVAGGLAKIYQSVSDLNNDYLQSFQNKDALLKPKAFLPSFSGHVSLFPAELYSSSATPEKLAAHSSSASRPKGFAATSSSASRPKGFAATSSKPSLRANKRAAAGPGPYVCGTCDNKIQYAQYIRCPFCSGSLSTLKAASVSKGGGFVKGLVTYMVTDDLVVSPMPTFTSAITNNIALLQKFNIKDLGAIEEKIVHVGMKEGLELLNHSLNSKNSKTVLTDVFLSEVIVINENVKNKNIKVEREADVMGDNVKNKKIKVEK